MKNIFFLPTLVILLCLSAKTIAEGKVYGEAMPEQLNAVSLADAIGALETDKNLPQKITGTVTQVCQKKGCWLILTDNDRYARVTFKDYAFFVPTDTVNQTGTVYGVLIERMLSQSEAEHYAKDAGMKNTEEVKASKEYSIVAESVLFEMEVSQ